MVKAVALDIEALRWRRVFIISRRDLRLRSLTSERALRVLLFGPNSGVICSIDSLVWDSAYRARFARLEFS